MPAPPSHAYCCLHCGQISRRSIFAGRTPCGNCGGPTLRVPVLRRCVSCGLKNLVMPDFAATCFDCGARLVSVTPLASSLRERVVRGTTVVAPHVSLGGGVQRRVFYCQNPAQSGDTTGVGIALTLSPATSLLFCVSSNEVAKAVDYLKFYADLGVRPERILLVVGDARLSTKEERKARELLDELIHSFDDEQRLLDVGAAQGEKERLTERRKEMKKPRIKATPSVALGLQDDVGAAVLARKERDAELEELGGSIHIRNQRVKALLGARLQQRDQSERSRSQLKQKALVFIQHQMARLVGAVIPWEHLTERAGNQIYQDLLNLGVRTNVGSNLRGTYQGFFDVDNASFADIGQSTRDVASHLKSSKLKATVRAVRGRFTRRLLDVDAFVTKFCKDLIAAQPKIRLGSLRPTIVLIWVRGLNSTEKAGVVESGIKASGVNDTVQARLDGFKRNPQHVTTAQLYETIRLAVKHVNNKKKYQAVNSQRWLIPVPIGDEVLLDWYDTTASAEHNLYEGPTATNLIHFWKRVSSFAGSRFAQMYFIHRLSAEIDVIQLGIRSGAMEQGMYMGVPTIYFEEKDSPSGARMASLARELAQHTTIAEGSYGTADHLPFFFRLKTTHLIGLNQARTRKDITDLMSVMASGNGLVDKRVASGTLTATELDTLERALAGISAELATYQLAL